jgi:hypothetical protein
MQYQSKPTSHITINKNRKNIQFCFLLSKTTVNILITDKLNTYQNSFQISKAEPAGKNLRQDRTSEEIVWKCLCLNLHPSGPVFL